MKARAKKRADLLAVPAAGLPTAERLAKALRDDVTIVATAANDGGSVKSRALRIEPLPLDRYFRRQQLAPGDPGLNRLLHAVGEEYGALVFDAGMAPRPARSALVRVDHGHADPDAGRTAFAYQRLRRTDRQLEEASPVGALHVLLLRHVTVHHLAAATWAADVGQYRDGREGLALLREALQSLARIWGRIS